MVVVSLGQDLNLGTVTLQVDKDELGASSSDGHDTTSKRHSNVFDKLIGFRNGLFVLATELIDSVCTCELVRVRIGALITHTFDKCLSVFSVLRWILLFFVEGCGQISLLSFDWLGSCFSFLCLLFLLCFLFLFSLLLAPF